MTAKAMSTESLKKQMQSRREQQIASKKLHLEDVQRNSRFMSLPFRFEKQSIDSSTFSENAAILVDEFYELVAGGWFVDPVKYPNASPIISLAEFKEKAILVRGYYEIIIRSTFNDFYEVLEIISPHP